MTMHRIYISIGSNIDRHAHISAGLDALTKEYGELTFSAIYESESVGFEGSHFYNLVVGAETQHSIESVVTKLKLIEDTQGRDRTGPKFSPRTLDLDLLLYDDVVCDSPVTLPREEIHHNAFVLLPLKEIVPDMVDPISGRTYAELWDKYNKSKQKLWPVEFDWNGRTL